MNMNCGSIYRPDCKVQSCGRPWPVQFKRAAVDWLARFRAMGDWLASVFLFVGIGVQLEFEHGLGVICDEKKIAWVKWSKVLAPKKQGGLGVSSYYVLNRALLVKWVWRFLSHDNSLWFRVISAMHGSHTQELSASHSSTWSSIIKEINVLNDQGVDLISHCKIRVGNGMCTSFWNDFWIGDTHLRYLFPRLYALDSNKESTVADKLQVSITSSFHRAVRGGAEAQQLVHLLRLTWAVILSNMEIDGGICIDSILCATCGKGVETTSHLFFSCSVARDVVKLITRWWCIDDVELESFDDWEIWFDNVRLSQNNKKMLEGVFFLGYGVGDGDADVGRKAQRKQQSLYNGKVLLEKHDPPVVHDSEETLQLAQESRQKMKQLNKEIKPANYTKINHLSDFCFSKRPSHKKRTLNHLQRSDESLAKRKALELEIVRLLRAVVSDQKGNTNKVYECDTKFAKQSILGKPPSSSRPNTVKPVYSTNIYAFPTVGETKCFVLKSSTSKLSSSSESPIVVNTERSDCSRIFRSILLKLLGSGLQVVTNGRFFDIQGQIRVLSKSESQSDCSKGDNACTSNPQEPINKRFPSSTFSMSGCQKWFDTLLIPLLSEYNLEDKEDHGDNECDT
ncbi:hypothetical protein Tco_0492118 [Tanacetum coccineum]